MSEYPEYDLDDDLLAATGSDGRHRVRVRRYPGVAVVLGRASKPELELHLSAIEEDGVAVLRRTGGGCAVVVDPGNVLVSSCWLCRALAESAEPTSASPSG